MPILKFQTPLTQKENHKLREQLSDLISHKIRLVRTKKGLTQQELAEKSGLHLTYIGHLESGKYHPSVFTLWKIANVLRASLNDFISY